MQKPASDTIGLSSFLRWKSKSTRNAGCVGCLYICLPACLIDYHRHGCGGGRLMRFEKAEDSSEKAAQTELPTTFRERIAFAWATVVSAEMVRHVYSCGVQSIAQLQYWLTRPGLLSVLRLLVLRSSGMILIGRAAILILPSAPPPAVNAEDTSWQV